MRIFAAALIACARLAAQDAGLEGSTINVATGLPLPGVHVKLFAGAQNTFAVYGALSDRTGSQWRQRHGA
jgi:hypothetical protein